MRGRRPSLSPLPDRRPVERKTLIFIEDGSFTYDNRVIREATTLVAAGFDVTVISPRYPGDPFRRIIHPRLRIYFYPKNIAVTLPGRLAEHSSTLFFGSLLTGFVFLRHGFSVFHATNPIDILWLVALPYRMLGRRFIFDHHDLCPELFLSRKEGARSGKTGFLYQMLLFLEKCSVRLADVVISTNDSYKEIVANRAGKPKRGWKVVRNGPDLVQFRMRSPEKGLKQEHEILVGYLGNMNEQDGVEYLLKAASHILRRRSDIRFVLVGSGPSLEELKRWGRGMGIDSRLLFTGRLPHDRMIETLSACDICVQPDPLNRLNDVSTMNKAMEYMALEKPVVAFDLKETRITCGEAALYARPNCSLDLAGKILELAGDAPLRGRLGKAGRDRVQTHLSWEHSAPELLGAYEMALSD